MRLQKRATLARISSAVLVQTKGWGRRVGGFDIGVDGLLQFARGAAHAPADLLFG